MLNALLYAKLALMQFNSSVVKQFENSNNQATVPDFPPGPIDASRQYALNLSIKWKTQPQITYKAHRTKQVF